MGASVSDRLLSGKFWMSSTAWDFPTLYFESLTDDSAWTAGSSMVVWYESPFMPSNCESDDGIVNVCTNVECQLIIAILVLQIIMALLLIWLWWRLKR